MSGGPWAIAAPHATWVWSWRPSARGRATGRGDGVNDDGDGLVAGGGVGDDVPPTVALGMEDRRAVIGGTEPGDGGVVALGTKGGGKPLRLRGGAGDVVVTAHEMDVGTLVGPAGQVVEPGDRIALEFVVAAGEGDDDVWARQVTRAATGAAVGSRAEGAEDDDVSPERPREHGATTRARGPVGSGRRRTRERCGEPSGRRTRRRRSLVSGPPAC